MRNKIQNAALVFLSVSIFSLSCQKQLGQKQLDQKQQEAEVSSVANNAKAENPPFNLEVILRGDGNRFGLVKFRQDNDPAKIITLDTWVRDLEPNHNYLLQRAVDNVVDDNGTSTNWLTPGKGPTAQSILTDAIGTGREELWRDVSAVPTGSEFDIHFQVVDAVSGAVVLTSDCYQFIVR
jgi:hypothetical protein